MYLFTSLLKTKVTYRPYIPTVRMRKHPVETNVSHDSGPTWRTYNSVVYCLSENNTLDSGPIWRTYNSIVYCLSENNTHDSRQIWRTYNSIVYCLPENNTLDSGPIWRTCNSVCTVYLRTILTILVKFGEDVLYLRYGKRHVRVVAVDGDMEEHSGLLHPRPQRRSTRTRVHAEITQ